MRCAGITLGENPNAQNLRRCSHSGSAALTSDPQLSPAVVAATPTVHQLRSISNVASLTRRQKLVFYVFVSLILIFFVRVLIVKGKLRPSRNVGKCEEGQLIDFVVVFVVRDCELAYVRIARVVDESCGSSHVLSINDITVASSRGTNGVCAWVIVIYSMLIQAVQVGGFQSRKSFFFALSRFCVCDDLPTVGINELTPY